MTVFVTGAGGFLGQALIDVLIASGKKIQAFDYSTPSDKVLGKWKGAVDFRQGDIRDAKLVTRLIAEAGPEDAVIHLAGIVTAGCDRDPEAAISINLIGTRNVLEAARAIGKKRVLFASTIGVYGRGLPQPITEDMRLEPDGWYGLTKLQAEQMGQLYNRRFDMDFRAVRFAAVTGANRVAVGSASLFTSRIPEMAAKGQSYAIEVTPDTSYPVVYIKDAVDALVKLMEVPAARSTVYNIASGNVVVTQMVDYIRKVIPEASYTYEPVEDIMAVVSGYKEWTIGCDRAAREIGWKPFYSVEKMVDDIIVVARSSDKCKTEGRN